ncbi:MAG: alpha/beta fold hydrolase [Acidimicrobiia bacterium]
MTSLRANGITIECETIGEAGRPPLLLVMGLGAQLVSWPKELCQAFADQGFLVIRYDNRDVGLSTKMEGPPPDLAAAAAGDLSGAGYGIAAMADDGIGVMDALGIDRAHLVGVSMGGMIVQHMAMNFPDRLLSLCSIMSAPTGSLFADPPTDEATAALTRAPATSRQEASDNALAGAVAIGSPGFPLDEARVRARAELSYDRCFYPQGFNRQLLAVLSSGDWSDRLAEVNVPTLVIHGSADPLVRPSWGEATARAIPGARLLVIPGMGHDLPEGAWPELIEAIVDNAGKATSP